MNILEQYVEEIHSEEPYEFRDIKGPYKEGFEGYAHREFVFKYVLGLLDQLDEPEVLSQEFIDKYKVDYDNWMPAVPIVHLQNLLVPKQEEVNQAYKVGYETGKKHAFEKVGLSDKGSEPETVADVISDFWKSFERLKEVLGTEVKELEE